MTKLLPFGGVPIDQWDPDEYLESVREREAAAEVAADAVLRRRPDFCHSIKGDAETIWLKGRKSKRAIHGIASTPKIDGYKTSVVTAGIVGRVPLPLLWQHKGNATPIGEVFHIRKRPAELYVQADFYDNEAASYAWDLVEQKELRCFSIAAPGPRAVGTQGIVDGVHFYDRWELSEISICRQGVNPDCVFEILYQGGRPPSLNGF